jgi:hypothetical protein
MSARVAKPPAGGGPDRFTDAFRAGLTRCAAQARQLLARAPAQRVPRITRCLLLTLHARVCPPAACAGERVRRVREGRAAGGGARRVRKRVCRAAHVLLRRGALSRALTRRLLRLRAWLGCVPTRVGSVR